VRAKIILRWAITLQYFYNFISIYPQINLMNDFPLSNGLLFKDSKNTLTRLTLILVFAISTANVSFGQTVPSYISTNGLLGWYPFSGNANNAFGTGKNGTVMGPILTTDRFGGANSAYHFDGNLDHIVIDTNCFNVGWSNYTISFWLNTDSLNNPNNANNSQESFNTIPHNGIGISDNWGHCGKHSLYLNSNPASVSWNIMSPVHSHDSSMAHVWKHMVFSKQNDTVYSFYVNGILDTTCVRTLTSVNYYCKVLFGNIDSSMGDEGFMGKLDDYGMWTRTLAGCEVRRLFNSSPYSYLTVQPSNVSSSPATTVHFSVTDTGLGATHQWQMDSLGTGYTNLSNTGHYSGVTTPTLTVSVLTSGMNNYKYRCVVGGSSVCVDTSGFGKLTVITTGITNNNAVTAITIAPNPTTGDIAISGAGKTDIKVYNNLGQLVKEARKADAISVASLPVGMYLVKLFDDQGKLVYYDKIVKQ
jgi:hypothetical protein